MAGLKFQSWFKKIWEKFPIVLLLLLILITSVVYNYYFNDHSIKKIEIKGHLMESKIFLMEDSTSAMIYLKIKTDASIASIHGIDSTGCSLNIENFFYKPGSQDIDIGGYIKINKR